MSFVLQRESFALSARVLGALFYFAPDSAQAEPLVAAFSTSDWATDWPLSQEQLHPVLETLQTPSDEPLRDAWQRLFIGPYALPAPPWGSVWLDRESVLFGESQTLTHRRNFRLQHTHLRHGGVLRFSQRVHDATNDEGDNDDGEAPVTQEAVDANRKLTFLHHCFALTRSKRLWSYEDGDSRS
jgi:hypothetical protein